jgi:thiazole synthase
LGTGKYKTLELMRQALIAAQPAMVTVAIRRVDLRDQSSQSFWKFLPEGLPILPNTAGCYTTEDAVRTARLAREALNTPLVKVEVIGDPKTLYPDVQATLEATKSWLKRALSFFPTPTMTPSWPNAWKKRAPRPLCRWPHPSAAAKGS